MYKHRMRDYPPGGAFRVATEDRHWIVRLVARIAPVDPDRLIPPYRMRELRHEIAAVETRLWIVGMTLFVLFAYPATWAVGAIARTFDGSADAVVYSTYNELSFGLSGLMVAAGLAWLPTRGIFRLWRGDELDLYDRYEATRYGFDGWRAQLAIVVVLVAFGVRVAADERDRNDVIGPSGIRCRVLRPHERAFAEVTAVREVGNAGHRWVEIDFQGGQTMALEQRDEAGLNVFRLDEIASYVAEHAGIPLANQPP